MSTAGSPAQALEVPAGPEQVTPEWLTAALRTRDQQHPAVAALDWEPVSDGLGFAGRVVRLKLRYEHGAPEPGRSMIGKFAAPLASARELLNDFGGY
ncbi:MAG TPA: hypothetical protein VNO23_00300, partial [Candidatus Binatia bacterium]|nr:hypothetical protein [Candidatus Binatia bacterium]